MKHKKYVMALPPRGSQKPPEPEDVEIHQSQEDFPPKAVPMFWKGLLIWIIILAAVAGAISTFIF